MSFSIRWLISQAVILLYVFMYNFHDKYILHKQNKSIFINVASGYFQLVMNRNFFQYRYAK